MRRKPGAKLVLNGAKVKGTWRLEDTGWTWSDFFDDGDDPIPSFRVSYQSVGALKRCIDLPGRTLSRVPFDVMREGTDNVVWQSERRPGGDAEGLADLKMFIRQSASSLTAMGAAYGLKDRKSGPDVELTYASPLTIRLDKRRDGIVYRRKVKECKEYVVPPELIVPIFQPDWAVEQGPGAADAQAGLVNAQVLYALHTFLRGYLHGGLVKASYLTWTGDFFPDDDEEIREAENWWQSFLRKVKSNAVVRLIDSRIKPEVVGEGLAELADVDIEELQIKHIAMACGVPISILQSEAANYATALVDRWTYMEDTLLPTAEVIGEALNDHLLSGMGLELVWRPERSPVYRALEKEVNVETGAGGSAPIPEPSGDGAMTEAEPVVIESESEE